MKTRATALAVVASLALVACGDDKDTAVTTTAAPVETAAPTTAAAAGDIVAVAAGNADFSTLVAAVKAAGLVETLQGAGPFTVFAPTTDRDPEVPRRSGQGNGC